MAKNETENNGNLMLYSNLEQQRLEALGVRLFVSIPKNPIEDVVTKDDDFWQSRLGKNIQLVAKNIDINLLPVAKTGEKHFAKRLIWQKLRFLLKS
jgi:hypothetical protein